MLQKRQEKQQAMELVIIDQLVPEDHLLRKIDRSVDFSFIRKLCEPLYCMDNGRPAIEPEVLFRMLFVGYLYGIRSERRLEEEINYNIAYKWFCGLRLTEKAPDATTLSVNRKRRFRDNNIPEQIFNEILRQAIAKGLVGGEILYTDSTHIKAKANKYKKQTVTIDRTPKAYMEELDAAIGRDRETLGKKPFEKKDDGDPPTADIQQSKHDPESGQLHKEGNGKRIYAWRKETIERSFAEAKELHGLRYARMLGIRNMYEQSYLTAAVQNMKRIAKALCSLFDFAAFRFLLSKDPAFS